MEDLFRWKTSGYDIIQLNQGKFPIKIEKLIRNRNYYIYE